MLYSDLPEYKLGFRDLRGGGGGAAARPPAMAAPQLPPWFTPRPGGTVTNSITSMAPAIMGAMGSFGKTPSNGDMMCIAEGCNDPLHAHPATNDKWLGALGAISKGAGTAIGGPTASALGNLGNVAAGMMSQDQERAARGRQISQIMRTYANDPEMRRDALMAFYAQQGLANPYGR